MSAFPTWRKAAAMTDGFWFALSLIVLKEFLKVSAALSAVASPLLLLPA